MGLGCEIKHMENCGYLLYDLGLSEVTGLDM
jgi:hypothetical protein